MLGEPTLGGRRRFGVVGTVRPASWDCVEVGTTVKRGHILCLERPEDRGYANSESKYVNERAGGKRITHWDL